jgi:hypothetical protein
MYSFYNCAFILIENHGISLIIFFKKMEDSLYSGDLNFIDGNLNFYHSFYFTILLFLFYYIIIFIG